MKLRCLLVATSVSLAGCQTDGTVATELPPPDAKAIVLQNKGQLWKDPDSIKNASIGKPKRNFSGMWLVCVRANAKNGFGGYTGEQDNVIGIYDDATPPRSFGSAAVNGTSCDTPYEPFPELNGDYVRPVPPAPKPKRA